MRFFTWLSARSLRLGCFTLSLLILLAVSLNASEESVTVSRTDWSRLQTLSTRLIEEVSELESSFERQQMTIGSLRLSLSESETSLSNLSDRLEQAENTQQSLRTNLNLMETRLEESERSRRSLRELLVATSEDANELADGNESLAREVTWWRRLAPAVILGAFLTGLFL